MTAAVILIEATPLRASDGAAQSVRLAGGGAFYPYYYGGQHWRAGVVGLPTFITSIDFAGDDFGNGGVPQAAELQWAPSTKADLSTYAGYFWIDAPITVRIGPENASGTLPDVRLTGKVLSALVDGGTLKIALSDPAADLKKPLLTERFGGTGGLDGPSDWSGRIKERVWGRVWNKAGAPIDKANNIYAFADPGKPIQAFDAVRDKGAAAAALTTLAWQGSLAATFAALQAASAPRGGGVVCPSLASVKWWTQPAGDLTADLRGEIGTGYVETTAEIVQRIVAAGPNTAFASGTIAAAVTARPAPVGWVAKDDSTTVAAMIEELLGNSSLLWILNATGQIEIRAWTWGSPAISATSQSVKRTATFRPTATRKIGWRRNERQMARGDLAAIVLAEDVMLADGRSGEALAAQIGDVQALADASAGLIEAAADDGFLDRKEKSSVLVPRDAALESFWAYLDGQAASAGSAVASARATAAAARTAWRTYRDALSPAWNNDALDTAVVRATLVGKINDYSYALDLLADALRQFAATTASWTGVAGAGKPADNATRNDDSANMLEAPLTLDTGVQVTPIAFREDTGASGAARDRWRIRLDSDLAFYYVQTKPITVSAGEKLWLRVWIWAGSGSSGTAQFGLLGFSSTDMYTGDNIAGPTHPASIGAGWYAKEIQVTIPAGVAQVRPYFQRYGGVDGGSFWFAEPIISRAQSGADITAFSQHSLIGAASGTFQADYANTLLPGQINQTFAFQRKVGTTDVSSSAIWSIAVTAGTTSAISSTGVLSFTAVADGGKVVVSSTYGGNTQNAVFAIYRPRGNPPSGGAGASSATASILGTATSGYGGGLSDALTVRASSSGQIDLVASVSFFPALSISDSVLIGAYGKFSWKAVGGTYADVASEQYCIIEAYKSGTGRDVITVDDLSSDGNLEVSMSRSGLTPGADYVFLFQWRSAGGPSLNPTSFSITAMQH